MRRISLSTNRFLVLSISTVIFLPVQAYAGASTLPDMSGYLRMLWGLLLVLGIILLLYTLLRKRFSLLASTRESKIKIIELKPLMGKKALCLVKVKDREYLIGLSGDNISHLATLTDQPNTSFAATLEAIETENTL